ncbi:Hypothetical predicted protein [Cloeon dipterum]|uniref:serine--tRNA ligase n=1 Tax=Cloeon dipterum TaxID=197152 RepID=A0A8S1D0H7_9INSE|nr:Hypothetical predicted protein [Cloeon dipterum]
MLSSDSIFIGKLARRSSAVANRCLRRWTSSLLRPGAELNTKYICDPTNADEIEKNIKLRKCDGDIRLVHQLFHEWQNTLSDKIRLQFEEEALKIPNRTLEHREENKCLKISGHQKPDTKPLADVAKKHGWCRTNNLGNFVGPRGYYFFGELVDLQQALVNVVIQTLLKKNFQLVSVPDILPAEAIENCGMPTRGERTQVFRLDERHGNDLCLSGTAEMGLGARFMDTTIAREKLPLKVAAISRCFRAETGNVGEEKGIYRVYQFTKVEMFALTPGDIQSSQTVQNEFVSIQTQLNESLGLHFRLLDMASDELGKPAMRKVDLEAWMPGRRMWGELSSCSDCGDYQSRRLNIREAESGSFVHTVNGTALAVPRTLMALVETHQTPEGTVVVPEILRSELDREVLGASPEKMTHGKYIRSYDGN